jgi:DNA-binding NarL/FixJ family response regulator
VCAECPNRADGTRAARSQTASEYPLPPFAEQAIAALTACRKLTRREREVLTLCCSGQKNRAIAVALGISSSAVRRHLRNLHRKTYTSDKAELILNLWHSCAMPPDPREAP